MSDSQFTSICRLFDLDPAWRLGAGRRELIAAAGAGEDELVEDFKKAWRGARTGKR